MKAANDVITLRPATPDDSERLLIWRNEPETRKASRNTAKVSVDEHSTWYSGALGRDDIRLLIAEHDGMPVGMVRFDVIEGETAEVSINLDPACRGRGFGKRILEAATSGCGFQVLKATVRAENEASVRLFTTCGFIPVAAESGFTRFELRR